MLLQSLFRGLRGICSNLLLNSFNVALKIKAMMASCAQLWQTIVVLKTVKLPGAPQDSINQGGATHNGHNGRNGDNAVAFQRYGVRLSDLAVHPVEKERSRAGARVRTMKGLKEIDGYDC